MRLAELVRTSIVVASTSSRLGKIQQLADLIRQLTGDEAETAVAFLSGTTRQGRIGIGHTAISSAAGTPHADAPTLELRDVDLIFATLSQLSGKGVTAE